MLLTGWVPTSVIAPTQEQVWQAQGLMQGERVIDVEYATLRCGTALDRMPTKTRGYVAAILLAAIFVAPVAPVWAAELKRPLLPADTSSPRAMLKSFIDSCNEAFGHIKSTKYYDRSSPEHRALGLRILDCLDVQGLPEYARQLAAGEAAVCLKEILDRVDLPPYDQIPDSEAIEAAGGPDKLSRWQIPGTRIAIARVEEGLRRHEYLFTSGTVERAVEYYHDMQFLPYRNTGPAVTPGLYAWYMTVPSRPWVGAIVDRLPDWANERVGGLAVWQWVGLVAALLISLVLMGGLYSLQLSLARRWRDQSLFRYCLTIVFPLLAMFTPFAFTYAVVCWLTARGTPLYVVDFGANLMVLLASLVVVFGASNRISTVIIASPHINPQGLNAQFIRILSRLISLVISVMVFLEGGHYLGIPLTTLLASAGVGGLAVALAAQDTLKNLFGTIMLLTDKPFRIGERIVFSQYDGVVEEIGLRSTRIRLLTGHQATIPNDELARMDIENVGRRVHVRRVANIHLPLDTPREKVERAADILRSALDGHEGMAPEFPPRVYFNEFNHDSFNIRVIYWYHPPNYWDFLAFSEKLNLKIMRRFEEEGIQFSLPFRMTYTTRESEPGPVQVDLRTLTGE